MPAEWHSPTPSPLSHYGPGLGPRSCGPRPEAAAPMVDSAPVQPPPPGCRDGLGIWEFKLLIFSLVLLRAPPPGRQHILVIMMAWLQIRMQSLAQTLPPPVRGPGRPIMNKNIVYDTSEHVSYFIISKSLPDQMSVSSADFQKARRLASKVRSTEACEPCKMAKKMCAIIALAQDALNITPKSYV